MMLDHFVRISRIGRIILEAAGLPYARFLPFLRSLSLVGSFLVIRTLDGRSLWRYHDLLLEYSDALP